MELSERHLDDVFERFDRLGMTAAEPPEPGLGIAIAGRLIELLGGAMGIESAPGRGVMIWLQLPAI